MMLDRRNGDLALVAKLHGLAGAPFTNRADAGTCRLTSRVALWG